MDGELSLGGNGGDEMENNAMERNPVDAGVLQGLPLSPILLAMHNSGLIEWVEEYVSEAEELFFINNFSWVASGRDVNHIVTILGRCAAKSIDWASRQWIQFNTAMAEVALLTCRRGHLEQLHRSDSKDPSLARDHTIQPSDDTLDGHLD